MKVVPVKVVLVLGSSVLMLATWLRVITLTGPPVGDVAPGIALNFVRYVKVVCARVVLYGPAGHGPDLRVTVSRFPLPEGS